MNQNLIENIRIVVNFLTASDSIKSIPACDAIFIFGSTKTDRLPKNAGQLFKKGLAQKIICTGKYRLGRTSGPFGFDTEAEWFQDVLIKDGILKEAIILDTRSTNTLENVIFGISACHRQEFYPKSLILCPMPLLCRRSLATFKKQFPEIRIFSYAFELPIEYYLAPDRKERVLGEFERFEKYAAKGDIVSIDVPENVQTAVNFLKNQH